MWGRRINFLIPHHWLKPTFLSFRQLIWGSGQKQSCSVWVQIPVVALCLGQVYLGLVRLLFQHRSSACYCFYNANACSLGLTLPYRLCCSSGSRNIHLNERVLLKPRAGLWSEGFIQHSLPISSIPTNATIYFSDVKANLMHLHSCNFSFRFEFVLCS